MSPVRTCIACRRARPATDLVRFGRDTSGNVIIKERSGDSGRSAYLCLDTLERCLAQANRHRAWARAFRQNSTSPASLHCTGVRAQ